MLILIVPEEGEMLIEVGYGLEGAFPDSLVKRIIEDSMIPYFKEGRYSQGILSGFNEVLRGLEKEYNINLDNKQEIGNPIVTNNNLDLESDFSRILLIIGIIIFLIIDFRFFRGMITRSLFGGRGGSSSSGGSSSGGSSGGGGRSGGGGAGGSW